MNQYYNALIHTVMVTHEVPIVPCLYNDFSSTVNVLGFATGSSTLVFQISISRIVLKTTLKENFTVSYIKEMWILVMNCQLAYLTGQQKDWINYSTTICIDYPKIM